MKKEQNVTKRLCKGGRRGPNANSQRWKVNSKRIQLYCWQGGNTNNRTKLGMGKLAHGGHAHWNTSQTDQSQSKSAKKKIKSGTQNKSLWKALKLRRWFITFSDRTVQGADRVEDGSDWAGPKAAWKVATDTKLTRQEAGRAPLSFQPKQVEIWEPLGTDSWLLSSREQEEVLGLAKHQPSPPEQQIWVLAASPWELV